MELGHITRSKPNGAAVQPLGPSRSEERGRRYTEPDSRFSRIAIAQGAALVDHASV
jgi:hypothetical protein